MKTSHANVMREDVVNMNKKTDELTGGFFKEEMRTTSNANAYLIAL